MLTLVTHTRLERPVLLERCVQSIEAAMVPGVKHAVIPCFDNWAEARLEALDLDEWVAFVDDDDTITPESLRTCLMAATDNVGIVCTSELRVDVEGKPVFPPIIGSKFYNGVSVHPAVLHHLCLIRRGCADSCALDLHHKFGCGIDWFIKASAGLTHSALHVPIIGYHWTQHADSMVKQERPTFIRHRSAMGQAIRTRWLHEPGQIPVFKL
jgi:glycosyltransferase involved in cell wall biosynthesis